MCTVHSCRGSARDLVPGKSKSRNMCSWSWSYLWSWLWSFSPEITKVVGSQWSVPGANWGCTVRRSVVSGQYIANLGIMVRVSGLKSEKLTVQP